MKAPAITFINVILSGVHSSSDYDTLMVKVEDYLESFPDVETINLDAQSVKSRFLGQFTRRMKEFGYGTYLATNANLLDSQNRRNLLEANLDVLGFWVESLRADLQARIRPGDELKQILEVFSKVDSKQIQKRVFYTHLLEENLYEIPQMMKYVQIQELVDSLYLQLIGTHTPSAIRDYRDDQSRGFFGTAPRQFPQQYFLNLLDSNAEYGVLQNNLDQLQFWESYFARNIEVEAGQLNQKIDCCKGSAFVYISHEEAFHHCPLYNPENHGFGGAAFLRVRHGVKKCDRSCHFKLNTTPVSPPQVRINLMESKFRK